MNDTGLLYPGRARSDDRTSGERGKLESSFLPNRRLAVRLSATVKTCTTMRGWTRELGGASRMRTLKYAFASFGLTTALERTMSRYRCRKRRPGSTSLCAKVLVSSEEPDWSCLDTWMPITRVPSCAASNPDTSVSVMMQASGSFETRLRTCHSIRVRLK